MKTKYKIEHKIISILAIIIIIINISNISNANLIGEELTVYTKEYNKPYTYGNEETKEILRFTDNNMPIYSIKKNNTSNSFTINNIEFYNDKIIKNILKNGYGYRTLEELEVNSIEEAYIATQEAIYIQKEGRNIDEYNIIEGKEETANKILNLTKKIIKNASSERQTTIEITTNDTKWKNYQEDNNYKYKEYIIKSINTNSGDIIIQKGENIKVIDKLSNEEKNTFNDGDIFYLIVPKDISQEIELQFSYEKKDAYLYIYKNTNEIENQYVFAEKESLISSAIFIENVVIENNLEILNQDKETKLPIVGNVFSIIKEDGTVINANLITNEEGKISIRLPKGKYYLKQTSTINGYNLNKALIEIEIENEESIKTKIESMKPVIEQINTLDKEINVIEENKSITENNITEVSNIKTTNIDKEIINETNETNLNNVNNFINTINRKNVTNLKKENIYNNDIDEILKKEQVIDGENVTLHMTRKDYVNYIDMIMVDSAKVPILPVASK